jgi:hypothetical protein
MTVRCPCSFFLEINGFEALWQALLAKSGAGIGLPLIFASSLALPPPEGTFKDALTDEI